MSANVSWMASGHNEVPWHKTNYTTVEGTMTSAEALKLAKLDFDVLQEPVFDAMNNPIPGYRLNLKSDDRTILGLVSDKYKVVQNIDAFAFTDNLIGNNCRYETAGAINDWKTTWLLAQLEPKKIMGDKYNNYLCFMNGFDGTQAVKVCITPIRVVCQNTLNLALKKAKRTFTMKHSGDIDKKMKEAEQVLKLSDEYLVDVEHKYENLAMKKLSQIQFENFLKQLFPVTEEEKNTRHEITQMQCRAGVAEAYHAEDLANFRGTAFGVVNAVSDYVAHGKPMRMTDSYFGNLFGKVMNGHPVLDKAVELVEVMA